MQNFVPIGQIVVVGIGAVGLVSIILEVLIFCALGLIMPIHTQKKIWDWEDCTPPPIWGAASTDIQKALHVRPASCVATRHQKTSHSVSELTLLARLHATFLFRFYFEYQGKSWGHAEPKHQKRWSRRWRRRAGKGNVEGCALPIRLWGLGSVLSSPSGSGEEPRPPANSVHNEDLKTHLVTTFCKYEHAYNMYQSGIKSQKVLGQNVLSAPVPSRVPGQISHCPCGVGATVPMFVFTRATLC